MYTRYLQEDPNYYNELGIDHQGRDAVDNLNSGNEANTTGIQTDAWYDEWVANSYGGMHPYKIGLYNYLQEHPEIKLVIDLHGSSDSNGWDVDIGNGGSHANAPFIDEEAQNIIINNLTQAGIGGTNNYEIGPLSINDFSGGSQLSVIRFISEYTDIDAVQLEFARVFRCNDNNEVLNTNQQEQTTRLISALIVTINQLKQYYL